ncbi:integral membrane protein [Paucilactobacillus hokkaidonensis JCM 18461]|uniref:Integral membrane protein n=2 Tax=Paucilactobacillus hokkaidonensis TaxID=1193095 RepID=A0A0A1GRT5_9LACO|nr:YoaK family protein [Paucilactobacillus hokkaidonensis]KRO09489.1 hypothetical protein IV59_GL000577 [Paucilactobacillus hokkaidonensis]BAP84665.1 integral membrane protein [Paucilactobacillus hokkaidonensis JCM 18461]
MINYDNPKIYQLRSIAVALTFCGGFIDAYTFIQRGGVLAAGQTGNIIFLSADIAKWNLPGALTKLATLVAFIAGIMVVEIINYWPHRSHYWRLMILIAELATCFIVGLLPKTVSNIFIVPFLSFVMAMQTTAFSQIEGQAYNNVFTTGNLKKAVSGITRFVFAGVSEQRIVGLTYMQLVLGFASGAITSAILQRIWAVKTIWVVVGILLIVGSYYGRLLFLRNRLWKKNRK